jgi:hypothetical protein
MHRVLLLLALPCALVVGCAGLIGVEPLSGGDAGPDVDASTPDAGPTTCAAVWVDASGGTVPTGAVNAEPTDAQAVTIYVCHVAAGSDVIPGKLRPDYGCYYGDGDAEVFAFDYQVLVPTGCTVSWVAAPDGVTQANSVTCGHDSQGDLFACRVTEPTVDQGELGHTGWGTNHQCIYSLSGLSLVSTAFDILTLQ